MKPNVPPREDGEQDKAKKTVETVSFFRDGVAIGELIFVESGRTAFAVWTGTEFQIVKHWKRADGRVYMPFTAGDDGMIGGGVSFPTSADEYGTQTELFEEIRRFFRKYVDLEPMYETLVCFYILLTWCHDEFFEIPYLHVLADFDSGKTRLGIVMKLLCYRGLITISATSTSAIFRTLNDFHSTLILDEGDLDKSKNQSEKTSDLIKILNTGYNKITGFVMRSDEKKKKFVPTSFNVYSPKIILSRERYSDEAFESRCLPIYIYQTKRTDLPLNLTDSILEESQILRNKLLAWRLKGYGTRGRTTEEFRDPDFGTRMNQLGQIMLALIGSDDFKLKFLEYLRQLSLDASQARSTGIESEIIRVLLEKYEFIYTKDIVDKLNVGKTQKEEFTSRRINGFIRDRLHLSPCRKNDGVGIDTRLNRKKIEEWCSKFGIPCPYPAAGSEEEAALAILMGEQTALPVPVEKSDETPEIPF